MHTQPVMPQVLAISGKAGAAQRGCGRGSLKGPGGALKSPGGALEKHMFKKQVSVRDLACMLATIDMDNILLGSTLQLTQKRDGCVSMSLLPDKTQLDMCTAPQQYRLLQATDAHEWPFVPEIRLPVLLQDLQNRRQHDRWGLLQKRISGVSVRSPQCREPACVQEAARYVLECLKLADAMAS